MYKVCLKGNLHFKSNRNRSTLNRKSNPNRSTLNPKSDPNPKPLNPKPLYLFVLHGARERGPRLHRARVSVRGGNGGGPGGCACVVVHVEGVP